MRLHQAAVLAVLAIASCWLEVAGGASTARPAGAAAAAVGRRLSAAADTGAWPKTKVINGLETLWQVPPCPQRVLFVAHGCDHSAADWWPRSPRCRNCLGLPEEHAVRLEALRRGYAVVAVSSYNRTTGCWGNNAGSEDQQRLPAVLKEVLQEEGLGALELFAFGASSGGGIVLRLAQRMQEVKGVIAQVVPARPALLQTADGRPFPPTIFMHMAQREPGWAEQVGLALEHCQAAGIPAAEVRIAPQPVRPQLLQRSLLIGAEMAEAIVAALREGGFLDEGGHLLEDPRETAERWQAALQSVAGSQALRPLQTSHVAQLLNVAYARHELTADSVGAALAWLVAGGRASIDTLLGQGKQHQQQQ